MPDISPKTKPGQGCPLATHVDDFVRKSQSLAVSVRTLRKEFASCSSCRQYNSCSLRESFQARIRAAVSELTDEWNLSESF
jgi:hypothetical protein